MNSLTIIGNLSSDPETRVVNSPNGPTSVTNFRIACNGRNKNKTMFIRATAWGNAGKTIAQYAAKGSRMMLQGEAETSAYVDASGTPRATLEMTIQNFEFLSAGAARAEVSAPAVFAESSSAQRYAESASAQRYAESASAMRAVADTAYVDTYDLPVAEEEDDEEDNDLPF